MHIPAAQPRAPAPPPAGCYYASRSQQKRNLCVHTSHGAPILPSAAAGRPTCRGPGRRLTDKKPHTKSGDTSLLRLK